MGKAMYNKLRNEEEWTNERIKAFWIYCQEKKQLDAPYESVQDDEEFDRLWDEEHPTSDSSTNEGNEPNEEEEQAEEEADTSTSSIQQKRKSTRQLPMSLQMCD